ncbi:hypothetical protein MHBO_000218 [Bonamia ostreae]
MPSKFDKNYALNIADGNNFNNEFNTISELSSNYNKALNKRKFLKEKREEIVNDIALINSNINSLKKEILFLLLYKQKKRKKFENFEQTMSKIERKVKNSSLVKKEKSNSSKKIFKYKAKNDGIDSDSKEGKFPPKNRNTKNLKLKNNLNIKNDHFKNPKNGKMINSELRNDELENKFFEYEIKEFVKKCEKLNECLNKFESIEKMFVQKEKENDLLAMQKSLAILSFQNHSVTEKITILKAGNKQLTEKLLLANQNLEEKDKKLLEMEENIAQLQAENFKLKTERISSELK